MPHRELNNHNTAKKNGYFLGHSDNLITLSLSGARLYKRGNNTFFYARVARVNIRLFLHSHKRSRIVFLSPSDDSGGDGDSGKE